MVVPATGLEPAPRADWFRGLGGRTSASKAAAYTSFATQAPSARPIPLTLVRGERGPSAIRRSGQSTKAVPCEPPWSSFESEGASVAGSPSGSSNTEYRPGSGSPSNHQPTRRLLLNMSEFESRADRVATGSFPPTCTPRSCSSGNRSTVFIGSPRSRRIWAAISRVAFVVDTTALRNSPTAIRLLVARDSPRPPDSRASSVADAMSWSRFCNSCHSSARRFSASLTISW